VANTFHSMFGHGRISWNSPSLAREERLLRSYAPSSSSSYGQRGFDSLDEMFAGLNARNFQRLAPLLQIRPREWWRDAALSVPVPLKLNERTDLPTVSECLMCHGSSRPTVELLDTTNAHAASALSSHSLSGSGSGSSSHSLGSSSVTKAGQMSVQGGLRLCVLHPQCTSAILGLQGNTSLIALPRLCYELGIEPFRPTKLRFALQGPDKCKTVPKSTPLFYKGRERPLDPLQRGRVSPS